MCVKAKRLCTTCLPSRKGHCSNMKQTSAPAPTPVLFPVSCTQQSSSSDGVLSTTSLTSALPTQPSTPSAPPILLPTPAESNDLLPPPPLMTPSPFVWGDHDSTSFASSLMVAYEEVVHWRKTSTKCLLGRVVNSLC